MALGQVVASTGLGGLGKTQLAVELGRDLVQSGRAALAASLTGEGEEDAPAAARHRPPRHPLHVVAAEPWELATGRLLTLRLDLGLTLRLPRVEILGPWIVPLGF